MNHSRHEEYANYPGTDELTDSDRHRLLAARQRRLVLDVLEKRTVPVELTDIAERVAARENDTDGVDEETVARVAISLHHIHLPLMTDVGVLDYNPSKNRVKSGPADLNGQ